EDDQGGREDDEHRDHRDEDPDGGGQAETPGGGEDRKQEGDHTDDDRAGAGDDRLGGPAQGHGHRLVPALGPAQLVAVAADEQQGVVRARTEDEDRQDADGGVVPRDAGRLEHVGRRGGGELVGHADDGQRDDPQDGA